MFQKRLCFPEMVRLMNFQKKHNQMATALRILAMDMVEHAQSGHPGLPLGAADIVTVLFSQFLKSNPTDPHWPDRDRFILSAGHGSALLYAALHLLGVQDFSLTQLKNFRRLGALTAGHPEFAHGAGIETTTGPLGQGLANAVGMAIAERLDAERFGSDLVDHRTYVLVGDGCLMEGLSQEALSLAGHLRLHKLIVLWDDNGITIDGAVALADSTDQIARFKASGWATHRVDGHRPEEIAQALAEAQKSTQPSFIACKTTIGWGAPQKAGTATVHGAPLGEEESAATRAALNWPHPPFEIPASVRDLWRLVGLQHREAYLHWQRQLDFDLERKAAFVQSRKPLLSASEGTKIQNFKKKIAQEAPSLPTRKASQDVLDLLTEILPEMVGGSADLTGSNNTRAKGMKALTPGDFSGRYIHWGIREHAMAAAMNGIALHGGWIPYGGTFLAFTDYCRPALRLSALMNQRVLYIMTHDSIGLGEDGPTHQPVEHLAALRAIPNLQVFRPADITETLECFLLALESVTAPSVLALTRQTIPAVRKVFVEENLCRRGAYEVSSSLEGQEAAISLFASGSEVHLALEAQNVLQAQGLPTRVVSVPCFERFAEQSEAYQKSLIGKAPVKIAIEAAIKQGWERFIGSEGIFIGMYGFGASAPYQELYAHFGLTSTALVAAATHAHARLFSERGGKE